jgi:hypothetical protein
MKIAQDRIEAHRYFCKNGHRRFVSINNKQHPTIWQSREGMSSGLNVEPEVALREGQKQKKKK